uniref:Signal recognition particle subunit SRP68 n=1 Tax=Acrobeloides nanus TaxID=290746 RepID=A0A914CJ56_9BILA
MTTSDSLTPFPTVSILRMIKDAQQKHGLRHGDYQRYRGYCTRKVKRIRKSLKFTHTNKSIGKNKTKFTLRPVNSETVDTERHLEILIFDTERNWAYAMQLKYEAGEDALSRKKFHMRQKLRKAIKHSNLLETLSKQSLRTDMTTKLEAQAYNAFIKAAFCLEMKEWPSALELYRTVKMIYEKLSKAVKDQDLIEIYTARCREVQNTLKLCEYNSSEQANAPMAEMIRLKLEGTDDLSMEFDKLLTEMQSKAVEKEYKTIRWLGLTAPVTSAKVKQILESADNLDSQLAQTDNYDGKISLYEKFLGDIRDVIQKFNEENRKAATESTDVQQNPVQITLSYLDYLRLCRASERYLLIVTNTRNSEKKAKPQEFLRLYDSVIENYEEVLRLPSASTKQEFYASYQFKIEYFKAFKCFYMAEAYAALSKWSEASALYERALERSTKCQKLLKNVANSSYVNESTADVETLATMINAAKVTALANRIAETAGGPVVEKGSDRPLIENLQEWTYLDMDTLKSPEPNVLLVQNPPPLQPMPSKPMFFDVSFNHIKMPDLGEKIDELEQQQKKQQAAAASKGPSPAKKQTATASGSKKGAPSQAGKQKDEEQGGLMNSMKSFFWGSK